jgi:transposase
MRTNINKNSFKGQVLYIGLDIHKKSWTVSIFSETLYLKTYTQDADTGILINYLKTHYPGALYKCVYEAGYFGFWIQHRLKSAGFNCMVVHPADIPTTDKQRHNKRDDSDSRKLARNLRAGTIAGIFIPTLEQQQDRSLVRRRAQMVQSQSRVKNRIKSFLSFYGIRISEEEVGKYWSRRYIEYLKSIMLYNESGQDSLNSLLGELDFYRERILDLTRKIRILSRTESYRYKINLLVSIPGISLISAMTILTEIMDIRRFKSQERLRSYIGLIPSERSSGEKERKTEMTSRGNREIKRIIVESAWTATAKDPVLTQYFEELCKRMKKTRAIIRVARRLTNRIMHVLLNEEEYKLQLS